MSKSKKIILGVLTFAPFFFLIWYFINIFFFIGSMNDLANGPGNSVANPDELFSMFSHLILPFLLMMLVSIGLLIYYLVDIFSLNQKFKNDTGNNKLIWTLVILFAGFIGMTVYFFVEIYPREDKPFDNVKIIDNEI